MRRIISIIVCLLIIILIGSLIIFSLKAPEMPIKEVHKVLAIPQQKTDSSPTLPSVPSINVPANNISTTVQPPAVVTNPVTTGPSNNSVPIIVPQTNIPTTNSVVPSVQSGKVNQNGQALPR